MNNIKTDLRNRLKNDLLFALMLLSNYDDFEFDFKKLGVEIGDKMYLSVYKLLENIQHPKILS